MLDKKEFEQWKAGKEKREKLALDRRRYNDRASEPGSSSKRAKPDKRASVCESVFGD